MFVDWELADDYRSFAALVSPVLGEREAFVRRLHPDLRTLAATTLADLTLRLGAGIGELGPMGRDALRLLPAETKARCAVLSVRLLEDWPAKLCSLIVNTLSQRYDLQGAAVQFANAESKRILRSVRPRIGHAKKLV